MAKPTSPALVVDAVGLRKTYFGGRPLEVLHGIDLRIAAGEFVAIIGQSGSGKSTLLNILGALDRPTEGTVSIAGVDLGTANEDRLAELRNHSIGFVFQFHFLLDEFTCLENALMPISIEHGVPPPDDVERITELLRRVGLGDRLRNRPAMLSGGRRSARLSSERWPTNPAWSLRMSPPETSTARRRRRSMTCCEN